MNPPRSVVRALVALVAPVALAALAPPPAAADGDEAGLYALTIETLLPHLEENLRYATVRQQRCLPAAEADTLFPLLQHEAFAGCRLGAGRAAADGRHYVLRCANPEAASGSARVALAAGRVTGVLEVKMGGKNMTLSQRLRGERVGACDEPR